MRWLTYRDKMAMLSGNREISYARLMERIITAGNAMKEICKPGDRIAIIGENSPEWLMALYDTWKLHAIAVPIDFMSSPEDIAYILDDCRPVAIWSDKAMEEKLAEAMAMLKNGKPKILQLESLVDYSGTEEHRDDSIGESDDSETALIIYTSGTTGFPKGVMLTFGNINANTRACSTQIEVFIPEDRVLVVLPLHHSYPLMASAIMPLSIGAASVFAQGMNGEAIMAALNQGKCTFIVGVPRLLEIFRNSMMQKIRSSKLATFLYHICAACNSLWLSRLIFKKVQNAFGGHIRYISSGGAAADPQVTKDFYALGFQLLEGYGMTETAPMISFTPPNGKHKPGSPGKPIPCNEIKICDGEVLVRGENVMKGYYGKPEETAKAIDKDGWLHTGDLGHIDKDGFLFLTGRSKELIILGNGKNIAPYELELKLAETGGKLISECAVSDDGMNLIAVVVPDMETISAMGIVNINQTLTDKVLEPYNEAVPTYKRISSLVIWNNPLPRTRLGKLRRHVIRESLSGKPENKKAEPSKDSKPDTETYRHLVASIEKIAGREIGPDEHFELEIGLDSLAKMGLLSSLNSDWGIWVDIEMLAKHPTARTLAEAIDTNRGISSDQQVEAVPMPRACWTHGPMRMMLSIAMHCLTRFKVRGLENIPEGPCIFAPNHQSFIDGPAVAVAMGSARFRKTLLYVYSKYIDGSLSAPFAKRHNMVPMEINGDIRRSIATLKNGLLEGKSAMIFPEGTRSMDGQLGDFKATFAQIAKDTNVPVVPVAIDGAYKVLPRGSRFPSLWRKVTITFLPPISAEGSITPAEICMNTKDSISSSLS